MSDDLLERATEALRASTAKPELRAGLTRARLLDSARERRGGFRGAAVRWGLAVAAVALTGTALARVAPELPQIWRDVWKQIAAPEQPSPAPPPRAAREPARQEPPRPEPAAVPVEEPAVQDPTSVPSPTPAPAMTPKAEQTTAPKLRRATRTPPAPPREDAVAPEPAELALFRRAQRLHVALDPEALRAWDDYLRVVDHGVLVPEARYNRALCLVRLGRGEAARAALQPFASGAYGDYRREEARALLQAMVDAGTMP